MVVGEERERARRAVAVAAQSVADALELVLVDLRPDRRPVGDDADLGSFLRERLGRGIDFGRVRPELEGWSTRRTAAQVLATPLAGGRATAATLRAAATAGLRLGPGGSATVLAGQLAWVAGEAIGYAGAIRSAPATV